MANHRSHAKDDNSWRTGYEAAIRDVLALLDEHDIRRSSLAAPLLFGFRADVGALKAKERFRAA